MADGRKLSTPAKPYVPPEMPAGKVNVPDPDSRNVKTPRGYVQGSTPKQSSAISRS